MVMSAITAVVDIVELEVYGSLEADARDVGPVEEDVRKHGEAEEDQRC